MASKIERTGSPINARFQEAGLGVMNSADKVDPDSGVRFSTDAVWCIKASIQNYVMRNWSMVRTGSTSSQKSLFFNMRRVRAQIERERAALGDEIDNSEIRKEIAEELGVPLRDVEPMEGRLAGSDFSLTAQPAGDEGREWVETIEAEGPQADAIVTKRTDTGKARAWLTDAFEALTDRERRIIAARKLSETPETLESLGQHFKLSKERIRQLEDQALRKMRKRLEGAHGSMVAELI